MQRAWNVMKNWLRANEAWFRLFGLLVVVVAGAAMIGAKISNEPYAEQCSEAGSTTIPEGAPAAGAADDGGAVEVEQPALKPDQVGELKFGRRTGAKSITLQVTNPDGVAIEVLVLDDFRREDGAKFDTSDARVVAGIESIDDASTLLALEVCADRSLAGADPGTYKGSVVLKTDTAATIVPITLKLSDTNVRWVLPTYIVATLLFGSLYTWALSRNFVATERVIGTKGVKSYLEWLATVGGIVSIVAGMAAALAVLNAQYVRADVWGDELWDAVTLMGSMFVAFIGAATIARIPGGAAPVTTKVPDLVGQSIDEAAKLLGGTALKLAVPIGIDGSTTIATQQPPAGTEAASGVEVSVTTVAEGG